MQLRKLLKFVVLPLMLLAHQTVVPEIRQPLTGNQVGGMIESWTGNRARHYGFSHSMVKRMICLESSGNPNAVSQKRAYGLLQVKLSTAREVTQDGSLTREALLDPFLNIDVALKYLRMLVRYFGGDLDLALVSYNMGMGRVDSLRALGLNPPSWYADKVRGRNASTASANGFRRNEARHRLLYAEQMGTQYDSGVSERRLGIPVRAEGVRIHRDSPGEQVLPTGLLFASREQVRGGERVLGQGFQDQAETVHEVLPGICQAPVDRGGPEVHPERKSSADLWTIGLDGLPDPEHMGLCVCV